MGQRLRTKCIVKPKNLITYPKKEERKILHGYVFEVSVQLHTILEFDAKQNV
jgi:hypothetical protein